MLHLKPLLLLNLNVGTINQKYAISYKKSYKRSSVALEDEAIITDLSNSLVVLNTASCQG